MNAKTQQVLLHIAGWMVFLTLPLLFSPESLSLHAYLTNPPTQRDLISYVMILAVFYLNIYWLIPKLYFRRKYFSFFLIGLLCFVPTVLLPEYIIPPAEDPGHASFGPLPPRPFTDPSSGAHPRPFPRLPPDVPASLPAWPPRRHFFIDFSQHVFLFLGMILLALMVKIRDRWKQTEKEKLQAQLSYLKAQINPHFLFNSLNSIYALAIEKSDQTPAAIVKLSEMMRYVLNEAGKEWVSLEKEIGYIRSYIALQQIRFGGSIHLDFQVTSHPSHEDNPVPSDRVPAGHKPRDQKIAPLILIPFIENAFKHGVNAEENSDIHIRIELKETALHLLVFNNKVTVRQPVESHSGLGIENTKKRLQLLYPRDHMLDIHDNARNFQVSLTLTLIEQNSRD